MNTLSLLVALAACVAAAAATPAWAGPEEALNKGGCMACHAKDKKLVGPSFKDIAAKYKGDKGNAAVMTLLTDKVRKGGKGTFGPIPMSPNGPDKISDGDLKAALEHILAS